MNSVDLTLAGLRAVAVFVALRAGGGIVALALVELCYNAMGCLAQLWLSIRLYPQLRIRLDASVHRHLGQVLSFSLYSFLLDVATELIYFTDVVIIGVLLPVGMITFYVIAANMRNYARSLVSGLSISLAPAASKLEAEAQQQGLEGLLLRNIRNAGLIMLPIAVTFMVRGDTFIGLWMGRSYGELCGRVLWVLALALLFSASSQIAQSIVLGVGKHKHVVPVLFAQGICTVAVAIAVVRSRGILGVAWASTIPSIAVSTFFWPWYIRKAIGIPVRDYIVWAFLRPSVSAVAFALCTFVFEHLLQPANLFAFFLQVGAALPLALLGSWLIGLTASERRTLTQQLRRLGTGMPGGTV
jgi:O-antigen/teichoic acid export membrane protein